jgi:hypothetical protein
VLELSGSSFGWLLCPGRGLIRSSFERNSVLVERVSALGGVVDSLQHEPRLRIEASKWKTAAKKYLS